MKKVKYLLGLFAVGFGLLINQSFAALNTVDIQLVNTQLDTTFVNADYSRSYSYLFKLQGNTTCYTYDSQRLWDLYGYGYNITNTNNYLINTFGNQSSSSSMCNNFNGLLWNSSYFGFDYYTGNCYNYGNNNGTFYVYTNVKPQPGSQNNSSANCITARHKFLFGRNSNSGQVFVMLDRQSLPDTTKIPTFGFGNNYMVGNDWLEVLSTNMNNGLRLFYNSTGGQNVLYDKDFVDVAVGGTNTPVFAWQYFTNTQTLTNYGYIVDTNGYKGKHFGSLGIGYSFVYNKDLTYTGNKISWNTLGFGTVGDSVLRNLRSFGGLDLMNTNFVDGYNEGILVLRKNQYTNNGDDGVILISKNPDNTKQLLYQEFSCQTNNIKCLMQGLVDDGNGSFNNYCPDYVYPSGNPSDYSGLAVGGSYTPCIVLGQGLLTYSGSSIVLPFNNKNSLITISQYSNSFPILSYFFDSSTSLGNVYSTSSQLCFGTGICFGKTSSSDSIKENYLNGSYNNPYEYITTGDINNGVYELCTTNSYFAAVNYEICHGLNPSDIVVISGAQYIIADVQYEDGTTLKQVIPLSDYQEGTTTLSNGFTASVCTSDNPCNIINTGNEYFSGGVLGTGYYSFDNTGLFFKCPYPYDNLLAVGGWDLSIGNFDLIGPINCFIAAFKHGKSLDVFDNVGLFDFGPLMSGNTQQHRILFRFFDMLIILGFVMFFSLIYKRFK